MRSVRYSDRRRQEFKGEASNAAILLPTSYVHKLVSQFEAKDGDEAY